MKSLLLFSLVGFLLVNPGSIHAQSQPIVQGKVLGLELLPQAWFGSALFAGVYQGQVGSKPRALGAFAVAVTHEDLPPAGGSALITGGRWEIRAGGQRLSGIVSDGLLVNNGDNTFQVYATLQLGQGGSGQLYFVGLLDHNVFPPTIKGSIAQAPF